MTKESSEFTDRRKFVRVDIYAITRYFCPLRDMEVGVQTRISDISEGGALIMSFEEGIPLEASVKMSFVMPGEGDRLVSIEGIVRHSGLGWRRGPGNREGRHRGAHARTRTSGYYKRRK